MQNFAAIDFETANNERSSVCSIGIVIVRGEEIVDTFSVGNHLRGISTYLLKRCGGRYDKYLVGKRLLNYIEIPTPEVKTDKLPMVDRLEAIVRFTKLLERSDSEALDYINRILIILKEAEKV